MPDESIATTGIDTLVVYLKEHGETDTLSLGKVLRVDEKVVEQWANILERANIVKISYRVGRMYVSPIAATEAEASRLHKEVEVKRDILESKLNTQVMLLNQVSDKVEALGKLSTEAELVFKNKAGSVKEHLDYLSRLEKQTNREFARIREQKDQIDKISGTLEKEIRSLEDRAVKIKNFELNVSDGDKIIKDLKNKLLFIDQNTKQILTSFNETISKQRKTVNQVVQSMNTEIKAVRDILEQQEREFALSMREQTEYKRSAENLKRTLARRREHIISEAETAKQTITTYFSASQQKIKETDLILKEMRDKFGGIAELDKRLLDINTTLSEIRKEKESISLELNSIAAEIHNLESVPNESIASRSIKLNNLMDRIDKTDPQIEQMKKETDNMKDDIDKMAK